MVTFTLRVNNNLIRHIDTKFHCSFCIKTWIYLCVILCSHALLWLKSKMYIEFKPLQHSPTMHTNSSPNRHIQNLFTQQSMSALSISGLFWQNMKIALETVVQWKLTRLFRCSLVMSSWIYYCIGTYKTTFLLYNDLHDNFTVV